MRLSTHAFFLCVTSHFTCVQSLCLSHSSDPNRAGCGGGPGATRGAGRRRRARVRAPDRVPLPCGVARRTGALARARAPGRGPGLSWHLKSPDPEPGINAPGAGFMKGVLDRLHTGGKLIFLNTPEVPFEGGRRPPSRNCS